MKLKYIWLSITAEVADDYYNDGCWGELSVRVWRTKKEAENSYSHLTIRVKPTDIPKYGVNIDFPRGGEDYAEWYRYNGAFANYISKYIGIDRFLSPTEIKNQYKKKGAK